MKISNAEIGLKGELVNEGFGDVKVKIQGKEVMCVKSILIHGNKTFKKLLEDEKCGDCLELFDGCDVEGFLEIEKYYSGGTMEFNDNNVCKILSFCVFYDDSFLLRKCKNYIKNHINDLIMMKLFDVLHDLNCNALNDLKEMSENYLQRNGYKYLKNDELLLQLKIEDLEWILSCKNLIIESENWLLNKLMKWKNEMKKQNKEEEENELKEEFIKLLKKYIHFEKIKINEISKRNLNEIKEMKLYDEIDRNNYISINVNEIPNDKMKDIIYKYYIEEDKITIDIEDIEILKNNNIEEIISILLNKDDIKLNEIGLLMIIECKIDYEIQNDIKSQILKKLLNEKISNATLKCLCLFVDDKRNIDINNKKNIITIENLCGIKILFKILNFHYNLSEETKKLLINYINEIGLTEEEENNACEIISDNEIINRIIIKQITSFSYPQSQYTIGGNISIKPSCDGTGCKFSINPSLPSGIILDKENGLIHGKVKNSIKNKEYEITCKNKISEKKFKIFIEFVDIKFTESYKSDGIKISNNGKLITKTSGDNLLHCYLDLNMENGIYYIKYKFIKKSNDSNCNDNLLIGLSTDNTYSGVDIHKQSTCNYSAVNGKSKDITSRCHIGKVVNKNPNFNNHGDGSIYEIIVDMNKREFSICHNDSSPVLLVKDLPSPLYPYVSIYPLNNSVELLSVSKYD